MGIGSMKITRDHVVGTPEAIPHYGVQDARVYSEVLHSYPIAIELRIGLCTFSMWFLVPRVFQAATLAWDSALNNQSRLTHKTVDPHPSRSRNASTTVLGPYFPPSLRPAPRGVTTQKSKARSE